MSGFKVNGVDLDTYFNSGSGGVATGFRNSGTDLNARYASYVSGTNPTMGLRISGTDVKTRFQGPAAALTASASPTSVSGNRSGAGGVTSNSTTCTPSGGTPGFTYLWEYVSGTGIAADSSTSATTTFSATLSNGASVSGEFRCKVTDSASQVAYTSNVSISLTSTYVAPLSVSLSETAVYGYSPISGANVYTNSVTATPSGGTAPYTYLWEYVSGDVLTIGSSAAASTTFNYDFTGYGLKTGYYRCKVTDAVAAVAYSSSVLAEVECSPP